MISLSISAVLLSASLLIFSVRPANAQSPSFSSRMDDGRRYDAVAVGNAFLIWNTQTGTYKGVYNSGSGTGLLGHDLSEKFW
ncbi:MAG: hypothetical protein FWD60_05440 [Candidatus Azobacteroides sp.]|nr:hypothetical protein [Candidatus Azobacteroides sp.]